MVSMVYGHFRVAFRRPSHRRGARSPRGPPHLSGARRVLPRRHRRPPRFVHHPDRLPPGGRGRLYGRRRGADDRCARHRHGHPRFGFAGLVALDHGGRESFQEFDLDGWFSTTTKTVLTLDDPDKAAEVVVDAMHTAVAGRPGPVVIGLPEEVLVRPSAATVLPPRVLGSASPYAGDLTELRARITAADRPVLIIGGEDWSPSTAKRIAQWSRDRGLGVLGTFRAYDGIDHDSPNFLGILG